MALVTQCENCGRTIAPVDANTWWTRIGHRDACSPLCAHELLAEWEVLLLENQHQFNPGSSEDLDCCECGDDSEAPQHAEAARPAEILGEV